MVTSARTRSGARMAAMHAASRGRQRRRDVVERARVVRKPMEQDDGRAAGVAVGLVTDLERPRARREDAGHHITMPPSMLIDWPVMYVAHGEQKNAMSPE